MDTDEIKRLLRFLEPSEQVQLVAAVRSAELARERPSSMWSPARKMDDPGPEDSEDEEWITSAEMLKDSEETMIRLLREAAWRETMEAIYGKN